MGRIVTQVTIQNPFDKSKSLRCDALVDTGASHLVLPAAWKNRLGDLPLVDTVDVETATQAVEKGEIRGPVIIQIEGFRAVANEVLFIDIVCYTIDHCSFRNRRQAPRKGQLGVYNRHSAPSFVID